MDIGFKDQSLIDSDEQLAGRINRNVKKKNSILYLFNLDKSYTIYGNDYRYKMTRDLSSDDYVNILYNKDFDLLYNLVIREIDDWNSKTGAIGFEEYRHSIINLNFYDINKNFKLIDQDTMSVFVPCKIDIINNSNDDVIFTRSELDYLIEKKIIYSDDKSVDGERVWEHYCNLITIKTFDFIQQKINFTILQGIMAKFTFSVFYNVNNHLLKYGSQQYGFLYLANYKEIYDYYFGIDDNKFEQPIFI